MRRGLNDVTFLDQLLGNPSGGTVSSSGTSSSTVTGATGGTVGSGTGGRINAGGTTGIGGATATGGTVGSGGKTAAGGSGQCPGTSTLKTGDNKATLQFGGRSRSYAVYVPSSVKSGTAVPLIFDFHGHGGSSTQEESSSGWKKKADQVGFVMVYPDGVDSSWNVGCCCGMP